jgi:hypothetical protein
MKKLIMVLILGILILSCSSLPFNFGNTPTPTVTPFRGMLIETFTPTSNATEIPTEVPTFEPDTTGTIVDTAIPEDTIVPEDTPVPQDTSIPETTDTPVPPPLIQDASVSVSFNPTTCPSIVPVTFSGTITIDPANFTDVTYRWYLSGPTSHLWGVMKDNISMESTFNAHSVTYNLGCGNYTIALQILSPNAVTSKTKFTIGP